MRPMSIVEDDELKGLCNIFGDIGGSNVDLPGWTEIRATIVEDADALREELRDALQNHDGYFCLTTDVWTDRGARTYMSLTIHYVDEDSRPHNKLLAVAHFPGMHTGARIGATIIDMFDDWNLDADKCTMLIRDGAGNAVKGARCLGLKNMSCVTHSLQLVLTSAVMRARKSSTPPAPRDKHTKKKATQSVPSTSTSSGPLHISPSKPSSQHQQTARAKPSESHRPGSPRPSQSGREPMHEKENEENVEEDQEFIEESEADNDDDNC
jgi:hypothetical protein